MSNVRRLMTCTVADYVFLTLLATLVAAAALATWWQSSLLKLLELRHRAAYDLLGRPSPIDLAQSDVHAVAVLRFLLAGEYKHLRDRQIDQHARVLRACCALGSIALVGALAEALLAPSPLSMLTFECWRAS